MCAVCQLLKPRILTPLLDGSRRNERVIRLHSLVFVSSSRFVHLARVVLELLRLDEICVPLEVSLSTRFTTMHFLMMCFNIDLPSWRPVLELFLREDVSSLQSITSPNLSWFRSSPCSSGSRLGVSLSPGPSGQFQIGPFAPFSMFVSILLLGFPCHPLYQSHHPPDGFHSTSSLRWRGFDTGHLCSQ